MIAASCDGDAESFFDDGRRAVPSRIVFNECGHQMLGNFIKAFASDRKVIA